jgi:hypothetical protein
MVNNDPVLVRQGNVLGATFHPELGESGYVHQLFLEIVAKAQIESPKDFDDGKELGDVRTFQMGNNKAQEGCGR